MNWIDRVGNYFLATDVPWGFRLLLLLIFLLIACGLWLDKQSSKIGIPDLNSLDQEQKR